MTSTAKQIRPHEELVWMNSDGQMWVTMVRAEFSMLESDRSFLDSKFLLIGVFVAGTIGVRDL